MDDAYIARKIGEILSAGEKNIGLADWDVTATAAKAGAARSSGAYLRAREAIVEGYTRTLREAASFCIDADAHGRPTVASEFNSAAERLAQTLPATYSVMAFGNPTFRDTTHEAVAAGRDIDDSFFVDHPHDLAGHTAS